MSLTIYYMYFIFCALKCKKIIIFLVKSASGSTLSSCAALCSNLRIATEASCNIYYVVSGICKAGVLDNALQYAKPAGSLLSLLPVQVVSSVKSSSLGTRVKPGKLKTSFICFIYNNDKQL